MEYFSIDRLEGQFAVLVDDNEKTTKISTAALPEHAAEGDVLTFDGKQYQIDAEETAVRRAEVKALLDSLS